MVLGRGAGMSGMFGDPHLAPRDANHAPLTPLELFDRTVAARPGATAIVWGAERYVWGQVDAAVQRMADGLAAHGVGRGDVVSVLAGNVPEMLIAHFAVPLLGAILNTINIRLDADAVSYILDHSGAKAVMADAPRGAVAAQVAGGRACLVWGDPPAGANRLDVMAARAPFGRRHWRDAVTDEWQPIALNYTSGTTGHPKGVVLHHRGAYQNAVGNAMGLGFGPGTVYLWTLPFFHCNGWCHGWAVTAAGGRHVCLDGVDVETIFDAIEAHGVTDLACAPVLLYMMLDHPAHARRGPDSRRVRVGTGGAAPTTALIERMDAAGFDLTHLYGLTESYGPCTINALPPGLAGAPAGEKAAYLASQGRAHATAPALRIVDAAGRDVPADGQARGEIVLRGATIMSGYLKDAAATEAAFEGGWFRTGDIAVMQPDGRIGIRDRAKDVIITGGENVSSLEVEEVLHRHPGVALAAVVAAPRSQVGRDALRLHRGARAGRRGRARRVLPRAAGGVQAAPAVRLRRDPQDRHGKGPEVPPAPEGGRDRRGRPGVSAAGFDPEALRALLDDRLGRAPLVELRRIAGGQSNPTFFVTHGGRRMVLRKQPGGEILRGAHAIDREYRVMSALRGQGVPVPETILHHDDPEAIGTPFYLMERLDGRVFADCALPGVAPDERGAIYRAMAAAMARLHAVDPEAAGLGDYGRPGNYFERQVRRWTRQLRASESPPIPELERLADWLAANLPTDDGMVAVAHGDFRLGNLMFHPTEPRVIAILDWELSTLGHPLADLGFCAMTWHTSPDEYGGIGGLDLDALGIPGQARLRGVLPRPCAPHPPR